jgi:hypothetical protein
MRLEPGISQAEGPSHDARLMLGPVREDIRQTLRVAWLDPGVEAAASDPIFFAAAWSAIRPSVGRSFLALARRLREHAADVAASLGARHGPVDANQGAEERSRIAEAARAGHLASAKTQIVTQLFLRAARRERTLGTGQEEPPARRGVPEWQRWLSVLPTPDPARPLLAEAEERFGTPEGPPALRPFARWPSSLEMLWAQLGPAVGGTEWRLGAASIRRSMLAGLSALPHPVELQWAALRERGFDEGARRRMVATLKEHDAAASGQTLAAAFAWLILGGADLGADA